MQFQDYYSTLGVAKTAAPGEIQKAYRKLARKFHPDVNRDPDAENRFKEIGEAYEVLSDEEKRKKYDQFGSAWKKSQSTGAPPPGFESVHFDFGGPGNEFDLGSTGFSSFFEMLFGDQGRGGFQDPQGRTWRGGSRPARGVDGQDRESRLSVTLEELAAGGKKSVELIDPVSGARKSLVVTLPEGMLPGKKIRLQGQGDPGAGGKAGNLFLTVDAKEHPHFRLEGRDLHTVLAVTPWEAALGGPVFVPTLGNKVEIRLPAGTSTGRKIRLRGRGLPNRKGAAGDLLVEIKIVVPETPSDEERELFEKLSQISNFSPRGEAG